MAVDKKDFGADDASGPGGSVDESGPLDLSDPEAAERRKRRKRGGLRIPSDNVPRPQNASDSRRIVAAEASAPPVEVASPTEPRVDTEPDLEVDVDIDDGDDDDDEEARADGEDELAGRDDLAGEDVNIEDTPPPTRIPIPIPVPVPPSKSGPVNGAAAAAAAPAVASPPPAMPSLDAATSTPAAPATPPKRPVTDPPDVEELSPAELEELPSGPHSGPHKAVDDPEATPAAATSSPPPADASSASTPIAGVPAPKRPSAPPQPPPEASKAKPPATPVVAAAAAAAAAVADVKPKKRKTRAWFEEIFDDDYLRTLPFLTPQATQVEAAFLAEGLAVKPGQQLLDLGCGYGRHAMELAARGYHIVALDLSLPLLIRGADEAQRRGLNINFVHGDMRELTFDTQFDGAYCVFSTFGYFDDEMNKRVAQNVARALKPGARFIIEILNRDYIVADLPTRVWWEGDGCVVLEEVDFNYYTSRMVSNRSVVFEDGRQLEQEISIRSYSLHELGKLLHQAGFRVIEVSGSLAARGRFFGSVSRQIIVIAERRANEAGREPSSPNLDVLRDPANKSGGAG